ISYNPEISAFTSGMISCESSIRLVLSSDYEGEINTSDPVSIRLFEFKPSISGKAFWIDKRTLEFIPDNKLPSSQDYKAVFHVSKLFPKKPGVKDFEFSLHVIPLDISIDFTGLKTRNNTDLVWNEITGLLRATDKTDNREIEKMITARQNGRSLPISWQHLSDGLSHAFTIDSVERREQPGGVELSWDAGELNSKIKGNKTYDIPALNDFKLLSSKIIQQPEQYIELLFSDPIKSDQYLNGLISLSNFVNLKFTVENNSIKVYPEIRQGGKLSLNISPGIKNILSFPFSENMVIPLNFEELKPAVRLIGQGVVLPQSEGMIFPFEAVNLKAVDVKVIRIYENNIAQFLQVNDLDGSSELKRAGRLIAKKTIPLTSSRAISLKEWNAFAIDLAKIIKAEPGAIYRVEIGFRMKHSLYSCSGGETTETSSLTEVDDEDNTITDSEMAYWDARYGYYSYDYYDYDYDYDYDWSERDNPCSPSYYGDRRKVARNILSTNLGVIAKAGNDKSYMFAVTDLVSTDVISGVKLDLYNFQNQLLTTATTDKDGFAHVKTEEQPYLLIASKDKQRAYLRLYEGASLSLSQFDVSGSEVQKGIKGFIYGERGVWRPGDSLFINFILEDKENVLPQNHPVSFELYDAQAKLNTKQIQTQGLNGFYSFKTRTNPDDATGNWRLDVRVGGLVFSSRIRIETVKPNRLKIKLEFPQDELFSESSRNAAKIQVNWLHGAPASALEARVAVNLSVTPTVFKNFEGFTFNDPAKFFSPTEKEVFNGKLNETGGAAFTPEFDIDGSSPGKLRATFTSRCFEKGGDFSIDQFSIPYSPYKNYIGLRKPKGDNYGTLVTDTLQHFDVVSLDESGKPVDVQGLEVSIYKLDWKWWWHTSGENLASYVGNSYYKPVFQKTISTKGGKADFGFKLEYPEWGRFLVRVNDPKGKHSTGMIVYFDWPSWVSKSDRGNPEAASMLVISADKEKYKVGETAVITIPSGKAGRILFSIENGSRVLDSYWLQADGENETFSFPVTKEMCPNVFVNVSLIQPHGQTKNDLPIRMYGVIPVMVEDPESHLYPEIAMPDILRPESEVEIKISEKNKKSMSYTIAIVDEGLLDLTRFKTPDPWQNFNAREALGVKTFDIYDYVMGAFGGRIDGVFSIGGGEDGDGPKAQAKANRFPPMVKVIGPFELAAGKQNIHKIKIPNYVGSVKTMVVAAKQGTYGNAEKVCPVRKPLMVLASLPRVLGPGESLTIPVDVFAMEDNIKKVSVKIETNEFFSCEETEKTVEFTTTGDKIVEFSAKLKSLTGIGKVKITARSGKEEASSETELEIRSPNPEITLTENTVLNPGEKWEKQAVLPGIPGTNRAELEVSSLPPMDFGRRLKYLLQYPYGCLEQTTSAAFPQLYLSDVMETDQNTKNMTDRNIKEAILKIQNFQLPGGGLGLWPNSTSENDWGTSYAGHFVLEAQKKGYSVSRDWQKKWLSYQKKTARSWTGSKYENQWEKKSLELCQTYRLYTLALAGEAELGAMNRMREKADLDLSAKWQLAAAYALAGQEKTALALIEKISTDIPQYNDGYYTYGSGLRDKGFVLQTLVLLNKREEAIPVIQHISEKLSSGSWYSTQTIAVCLMAVSQYAGQSGISKGLDYSYSINGKDNKHAVSNLSFSQTIINIEKGKTVDVKLTNSGKGLLFARLIMHGTPEAGMEESISQNLSIKIEYKDYNGKPVDVKDLRQGTDFMAVVSIHNPGTLDYYKNLALRQIFPSGWEIQNQRLFESNNGSYDIPEYQDIRDDRVYTFFSLPVNRTKTFAFKLTASYKGRFYLPGVLCEDMYRPDAKALEAGMWVEVK
ncbi:MAG: hypothetical protein H6540_07085, partial [Bacteroidales bacterium]|nr:hypothetical protein [Bacteroidales bacterium]